MFYSDALTNTTNTTTMIINSAPDELVFSLLTYPPLHVVVCRLGS